MDTLGYAIVDFIDVISSAKKARKNWWELALFFLFFAGLGLFVAYQVSKATSQQQQGNINNNIIIIINKWN